MKRRAAPLDQAAELAKMIDSGLARHLRTRAGLSLDAAARECEVTSTALLRWERGERQPRGRNIAAYHQLLRRLQEVQSRRRKNDDSDLDAKITAWVKKQLTAAPPLTSEQRDLLRRLLCDPDDRAGVG